MVKNEASHATPAEDAPRAKRRLRVLVADDDRDQVATLAALLRDEGYDVWTLYRGSEVPHAAHEFDPDVALIDIGMPGMTGYDVARELRHEFGRKRPLLIAITGWKQSSDRILAKLAGFDHHVAKPFDPKELLELIASAGTRLL